MNQTDVNLKDGNLYLSRHLYDRYFAGLEAVILLRREDDLLILPVRHAAAGGYILKHRNGAGDRVVSAPDFFRHHGLEPEAGCDLPVSWSDEKAGLLSLAAFGCKPTFQIDK